MTIILTLIITLLLAGVSAAAIFAATQVTAKSELFRGTRNRILDHALDLAGTYLAREALDEATMVSHVWAEFVGKLSDLANCAFCQTFWHAIWVNLATAYLLDIPNGFAVAAWLPSIALAKILHDKCTKRQIKRRILLDESDEAHDHPWPMFVSSGTPSDQPAVNWNRPNAAEFVAAANHIDDAKEFKGYEPEADPNPKPRGDTTTILRRTFKKDT